MKKTLLAIFILSMLVLSACGTNTASQSSTPMGSGSFLPFENIIAGSGTDVVIAQYIGRRPFGQYATVFEFAVSERVVGNAADRIFVYKVNEMERMPRLSPGIDYLLPLMRIVSPYAVTHDDGFRFLGNSTAIDINNPSSSIVSNSILLEHLENYGLDIENITRQEIISHIAGLVRSETAEAAENDIIRSDMIEDIIHGSPYVLVVEIGRPSRLAHEVHTRIWRYDDIYYATVISILKSEGNISVGDEIEVIFHANTVLPGEQHIVATRASSYFHIFTSRHSLFSMEQLNEINLLLGNVADITFDLNGGTATAGNEDDFIPQTIAVNTTATQPASDPVRAHHQFTGWYTDETGGTLFDFSTSIAEDTIIYARWVVEPATPQDPPTGSGTTPPDTTLSPSPYIPWTPRTGTPDRAYTAYGDDNDDAPGESTPPVFIPPPSINTLIFTVGNIEYLLRNQPRTSVGAPFIDRATDRMMIPLRTLSQALDTEVDWCSDMRSALVHLPAGTLAIPADELLPDGMGSAIIVNDRIFIPLRFVMYAFDADVAWDSATRAAIITW